MKFRLRNPEPNSYSYPDGYANPNANPNRYAGSNTKAYCFTKADCLAKAYSKPNSAADPKTFLDCIVDSNSGTDHVSIANSQTNSITVPKCFAGSSTTSSGN